VIIKFSRYNAPFTESPEPGVHFIALDDQLDMRAGRYNAHVQAFYQLFYRQPALRTRSAYRKDTIEYDDHISGQHYEVAVSQSLYEPEFVLTPVAPLSSDEVEFLRELYFDNGIKSVGHRLAHHFKCEADQ
jgi:hypothetical protein